MNVANSSVKNEAKFSVPKADNRFEMRWLKNNVPSPDKYAPASNLNQNFNSSYKFQGATKIGNDRLTFVDTEWLMKEKKQKPGPGSYASFSDFQGLESVKTVH